MKLTWFGNSAFRIHIGGKIVVVDAEAPGVAVDTAELAGGAETLVRFSGDPSLPIFEPARWQRMRPGRLLDEPSQSELKMWHLEPSGLVLEASGEPTLALLHAKSMPDLGRWLDGAAVCLVGNGGELAQSATSITAATRLRVLALAADEANVEQAFAVLRATQLEAALVALEPGLALEL